MITNERQYRITRKKALGFARAIDEFDARSDERANVHPRLRKDSVVPWRGWRF